MPSDVESDVADSTVSEHLAFFSLPDDVKLERIPEAFREVARQVLDAAVDNTGVVWRCRSFTVLKVVKLWARASASAAANKPHRGAPEAMKAIANFLMR